MLDYKALDKAVDDILESFIGKDLQVWIDMKKDREDLERLKKGETVTVQSEKVTVALIGTDGEICQALIDVKDAGENNYALAA